MKEIGPGIFVEERYVGGNVGVILTDGGPVGVDAPLLPEEAEDWMKKILDVAGKPLRYLILTDLHPGRLIGASWLPGTLIAPLQSNELWKRLREENFIRRVQLYLQQQYLLSPGSLLEMWQPRFPEVGYGHRSLLVKGDREIVLMRVGGVTPYSGVVYLPEEGVLFTGDLVTRICHPLMSEAVSKAWLRAMNRIRKLAVDLIVPGNGEVGGKETTELISHYIRQMRSQVRQMLNRDKTKGEVYNALLPSFLEMFPYADRDMARRRVRAGLGRVYDELKSTRG